MGLMPMPGPADTDILVVVPPMTQLNTCYAAVPHLVGHLRAQGWRASGCDLSLQLALRLYSRDGLAGLFDAIEVNGYPESYAEVVANRHAYEQRIEAVISFLQGRNSGLATRMVRQAFLPQGPRFGQLDHDSEQAAFGQYGLQDHARYLATLLLQDLADLARCTVAPHFGLTSYGAQVAESATSFAQVRAHLEAAPDCIEQLLLDLLPEQIPDTCRLVGLTCPFPGNVPAALRIGQWLRQQRPDCHIVLGGGYPSTELRELSDCQIFAYVDSIVIDDGEDALSALCQQLDQPDQSLINTWQAIDGQAVLHGAGNNTLQHRDRCTPSYAGIELDNYLDLLDSWNPVQRLWNEGRWLKLTAAHGCYWKRCTFCDISLPYIADYQPAKATQLADHMQELAATTGHHGFHFTDEAAPPQLLTNLSLELLRRQQCCHWWGNIRFDKGFTPDRCRLMAAAGMIAVTGGIEVADPDILQRIDKGVDLVQLTQVTSAFAQAGILVHGYLMYGFPGQTLQQSIDAMDLVRRLMQAGFLHAGFWHRFTATAHAPAGQNPEAFGIQITGPETDGFAWNNLTHTETDSADHDAIGAGLAAAMTYWQRGQGLEVELQEWFDIPIPASMHDDDTLDTLQQAAEAPAEGKRAVWLGGQPQLHDGSLQVTDETGELWYPELQPDFAEACFDIIQACLPNSEDLPNPASIEPDCMEVLRERGLVLV